MNMQQVVDVLMDDDSDMSEINDSDSSTSSDYVESDSDSTSGFTREESDDNDNGVHCPSSSQQPGHKHVGRRRDYIWQAANWHRLSLPLVGCKRLQLKLQ